MIDRFCDITGWRNRIHLDYWMALRDLINPDGGEKTGIYPCCGADVLAFFLITDAQTGYFIDQISFAADAVSGVRQSSIDREYYWKHKELGGNMGGGFSWTVMLQEIAYLEIPLAWELEAMGAEDISTEQAGRNEHRVDFTWAYWGSGEKRRRSIVFFSEVDARYPSQYPDNLKRCLSDGVDLYLEKAAKDHYARYNAPLDWGPRWRQLNSYTRFNPGSMIITTSMPDISDGYVRIAEESIEDMERRGARFGVWPAVLLKEA